VRLFIKLNKYLCMIHRNICFNYSLFIGVLRKWCIQATHCFMTPGSAIGNCRLNLFVNSQHCFPSTATLLCCSNCPRAEKTVLMLASAKLCLQTLVARIKVSSGRTLFTLLSDLCVLGKTYLSVSCLLE
jgi:hypothetical protein